MGGKVPDLGILLKRHWFVLGFTAIAVAVPLLVQYFIDQLVPLDRLPAYLVALKPMPQAYPAGYVESLFAWISLLPVIILLAVAGIAYSIRILMSGALDGRRIIALLAVSIAAYALHDRLSFLAKKGQKGLCDWLFTNCTEPAKGRAVVDWIETAIPPGVEPVSLALFFTTISWMVAAAIMIPTAMAVARVRDHGKLTTELLNQRSLWLTRLLYIGAAMMVAGLIMSQHLYGMSAAYFLPANANSVSCHLDGVMVGLEGDAAAACFDIRAVPRPSGADKTEAGGKQKEAPVVLPVLDGVATVAAARYSGEQARTLIKAHQTGSGIVYSLLLLLMYLPPAFELRRLREERLAKGGDGDAAKDADDIVDPMSNMGRLLALISPFIAGSMSPIIQKLIEG